MPPFYTSTIVCFLCISGWCRVLHAYTLVDEQNLQTTLLSGYNANLQPGFNRSVPLNISVTFYLFYIKEFLEYNGKFSVNGAFLLGWNDERLQWNSNAFNNLEKTVIPQRKIWIPNIVNINSFEGISAFETELMPIEVFSSGTCSWFPYQSFDVICDADVTKYPFDTQHCTLDFYLWGYEMELMNIQLKRSNVDLSMYNKHGVWEILNTQVNVNAKSRGFPEINVALWLKRRTDYYISSLIIPMFSITLLMGFVFLLPPVSGERVGFITTVSLSYIVFLTIIQDKLPESSEPSLSVIGYILMICMLIGTLSTALVIFGLRIHDMPNDKPVPNFLRKIVLFKCGSFTAPFNRRSSKIENSQIIEHSDIKSTTFTEAEDEEVDWTDVGNLFDRLCLMFCTMACVVLIITYISLVI